VLDSHADTCGVNSVTKVLEYTGRTAEVSGFANSLAPLSNIPIVKATLAYDHPQTGEVILWVINQALYFGDQLDEVLLNPNQIRAYGNIVDDVPKIFGGTSHSITIPDENIVIPLSMKGIISYFPVHTPTQYEIENCQVVTLTSEAEWDPYSSTYDGHNTEAMDYTMQPMSTIATYNTSDPTLNIINMSKVQTHTKDLFIKAEALATCWAVPKLMAQNTIQSTTQQFIRSAIHPIERRYRTKNTMLRYNRLQCKMYSDTFFSNGTSIIGNKCGQLFATDFGYLKFVPMKLKSEAGYALQEMIREIGIPTTYTLMVPKN
jgi:hypothetical protein